MPINLLEQKVNDLGVGTFGFAYGTITGLVNTPSDICSISLQNGATYENIAMICGSNQAARFQLVCRSGGVDIVIYDIITNTQCPTYDVTMPRFRYTIPNNGTYTLVAKGLNLSIAGTLSVTISGVQV